MTVVYVSAREYMSEVIKIRRWLQESWVTFQAIIGKLGCISSTGYHLSGRLPNHDIFQPGITNKENGTVPDLQDCDPVSEKRGDYSSWWLMIH